MGDYIDTYSKFLIGNLNFFNYIMDRLLSMEKINSKLILKVQRRLKVLKLIDKVSENLQRYFYGTDYEEILENYNIFEDIEQFTEHLLQYRRREIEIIRDDVSIDNNLYRICSKSYPNEHKYECSNNLQIRVHSDEFFLEDYSELDELYFVINEIAATNINFKIHDLINDFIYEEDRISKNEHKNYVTTKVTLVKIKDYKKLIYKDDIEDFILNRISSLDSNPIWKYYLLNTKISNAELPETIAKYAVYVKDNYYEYKHLDEKLYKYIAINSIIVLCEQCIELGIYDDFNMYFDELSNLEPKLLELFYLKGKSILDQNKCRINKFFEEIQNKLGTDNYSVMSDVSSRIHGILGGLQEQKGEYILAAQNYFESGEMIQYANKLAKVVTDLNKLLYDNNEYSNGMVFTSKIQSDHKFISDRGSSVDILNIFEHDYARLFTLELCSKEILENGIQGEVAELGVFRGDFAKLLNQVFSNKKLYLFDTFTSFNEKDLEVEKSIGTIKNEEFFGELTNGLKNTSVDLVMKKMKYPKNVIVKQGYFPKSIDLLEEKFCFVSLDVDLYKPTLDGLKYFYSRLSKGGYIFIHDYNHKSFTGVRKAVQDFESIIGYKLCKVPLSDQAGTLVITK